MRGVCFDPSDFSYATTNQRFFFWVFFYYYYTGPLSGLDYGLSEETHSDRKLSPAILQSSVQTREKVRAHL